MFHELLYFILTKRSGDIGQNTGPKSNSCQSFSICHWNFNSTSALNTFKNLHYHLQTGCYKLVRNLSWLQYFKWWWQVGNSWLWFIQSRPPICSLPLKSLGNQYLHECINFEIRIGGKLCRFVSLYRSPSQSQDDFESFANNFELNINTATAHNYFLTVVLGYFNAKSNLWFKGDKTT